MSISSVSDVQKIIQDYMEQKQRSYYYHKKKSDAEKEYNKLLVNGGGEDKHFSLAEATKIYSAFKEMQLNEELLRTAEEKFNEADEQLKELGSILFHASITADILIPPVNGEGFVSKQVTVSFPNGQALVI